MGTTQDAGTICTSIMDPAGSVCRYTVIWRLGLTEIKVFGVYVNAFTGRAVPIDDSVYTFR